MPQAGKTPGSILKPIGRFFIGILLGKKTIKEDWKGKEKIVGENLCVHGGNWWDFPLLILPSFMKLINVTCIFKNTSGCQ